jgi:hypothetical protein
MPARRHPLERQRKQPRITPYAVELFRELTEIEAAGLHERWESEGGQKRRYLDLSTTLDRELGLRTCDLPVMEARAYCQLADNIDRESVLLRRQLEAAARLAPGD